MCEPRLPYWHRKASVGLTFAIVPAGTWYPSLRILVVLMRWSPYYSIGNRFHRTTCDA